MVADTRADDPPSASGDAVPAIVLADATAGAGLSGAVGDRFSFGDYDGDGDPDLIVDGGRLWRNDTKGYGKPGAKALFADVTGPSGMGKARGGGACWADLDGDGRLDAVTTSGSIMLQQKGGTFVDVAAAWGLALKDGQASVGVGDFDGDGRPDLLFGGGEDWNGGKPRYFARSLWRNVDGKRLEDVTAAHDLKEPRYGRAVVWADYDADGDQDVYLGNYRLQPNELLANEGGRLGNVAKAAGVEGRYDPARTLDEPTGQRFGPNYGHTIAASWADLDGDGDLDLWVSNLVHKYVGPTGDGADAGYDIRGYVCDDSAILRNDGAPSHGFTDVRGDSGVATKPIGGRGTYGGDELWSNAACGDLDGDGLPEVWVAQVYDLDYSHGLLFRNEGGMRFSEVSAEVGLRRFNSYGGAFADVDGDGDLDLVCGGADDPKGKPSLRLSRNDTPPGPWIAFRLKGKAPATTALGAQVVLETEGPAGKARLVRQVESSMGSHAQQNETVLRFGLRGRTVKAAWVRWPGGMVQSLGVVRAGVVHDVAFPADVKVPEFRAAVTPGPPTEFTASPAAPAGFAWAYDLDGDGVFETSSPDGKARADSLTAPYEVRIRLLHAKRGVGREVVVRAPIPPAR